MQKNYHLRTSKFNVTKSPNPSNTCYQKRPKKNTKQKRPQVLFGFDQTQNNNFDISHKFFITYYIDDFMVEILWIFFLCINSLCPIQTAL